MLEMKVLNCEQMRELEAIAVKNGSTYLGLMEKAGASASAFLLQRKLYKNDKIVILCGKGNNGGDGYVIARYLFESKISVSVIMVDGEPKTDDAMQMYKKALSRGIEIVNYKDNSKKCKEIISVATWIVDAIYGIGFRGSVCESVEEIINYTNSINCCKLSIDLPSGAVGDTGEVLGECIKADYTISFSALKPAHILYPSIDYCGKIISADVGINCNIKDIFDNTIEVIEKGFVKNSLCKRKLSSHKGTYGILSAICGSYGMAGAVIMCSKSALRSGVGLLNIMLPKSIYPIVAGQCVEPVFTVLQENNLGTISSNSISRIIKKVNNSNAVVIGCGLGLNFDTIDIVSMLIKNCNVPMVIDADAINAISKNVGMLKHKRAEIVITPHPGEMARLLNISVSEVQKDRISIARTFALKYEVIVVLKGANTIIADKDGNVFVNRTGNPGMARGGSGDVLAGIIGAFLAQGIPAISSAKCGVFIHGEAGDKCAENLSQYGMLPTDMIDTLPQVFADFEL